MYGSRSNHCHFLSRLQKGPQKQCHLFNEGHHHPWISIHGYRWRTERSKIGGSMKLRWFIYENLEMEFRDGLSMETIAATTYSISSGKKGGNPCRPVSLRGWHLQKHQDLSDHSHGMKRCRSSWSKTIYIHYIYIFQSISTDDPRATGPVGLNPLLVFFSPWKITITGK